MIHLISKNFFSIALLFSSVLFLTSCSDDKSLSGKGKINLSIADAPVDNEDITGVFITITRVEMNGPDGWETFGDYPDGVKLDLLDYQNGKSHFLDERIIKAGIYKEVRLILDIQENSGQAQVSNPGSYLEFQDGSIQPLFVPSGGQSGYKAKGEFTLPLEGVINITLDFDVRKGVVKAGNSGKYLLKPTIRLVANDDAGMIKGNLIDNSNEDKVIVYAYKNDSYDDSEAETPENAESVAFEGAVTSSMPNEEGRFTLAFISSGIYDLYFVSYDTEGNLIEVLGSVQNMELNGGEIKTVEVSLEDLSAI